eukprot:CAMPEP_0168480982 /NCGR_PEP_ID=MMETSP0228-20121227/64276_1 /TAXON_ID=133427 /ORGANISM="Protoceratium reticulatum, Strain CCCM 535 (=CCMP 1889)" /LENGTH=98 /DNA_ID=CAMNT_0008497335 /DNA_START=32 /DNA_END=329 /DNA_ORIENTATION=-
MFRPPSASTELILPTDTADTSSEMVSWGSSVASEIAFLIVSVAVGSIGGHEPTIFCPNRPGMQTAQPAVAIMPVCAMKPLAWASSSALLWPCFVQFSA